MQEHKSPAQTATSITNWLKRDITVTAPGWAFAVAAVIAVIILGVALD